MVSDSGHIVKIDGIMNYQVVSQWELPLNINSGGADYFYPNKKRFKFIMHNSFL